MCRTAEAAALLLLLLMLGPARAAADDWPQFRGPGGQGHSTERGVPLEWSDTRNVLWKIPVPGSGWSSPTVADGRIWLTSSEESRRPGRSTDASLRALAFDVETGRQLVNVEVFRTEDAGVINVKNSRASPTPVVEGDRVYVHFGADGTAALTTSGDIVWTARFPYESQHGNGGSPILWRDLLIVSCDGADRAFVVALDKHTGKVRWRTSRRRPWDQAYSTPLVIQVGGRDQIVSVGAYRTAAYDPETGDEIWHVSYQDGFSNVPRPVFGHGLVFLSTGFQEPSMLAVRADGRGDVTRTHIAWTERRAAPHTPSPLLVGELLYMVSDIGIATCLDARSGKVHWRERLGGNYSASPVLADGRIYFLSEEGVTSVVAPGTTFQKLASSEIDGSTLASMAVSNGSFFIRTSSHLYRIGASPAVAGGAAPAASARPARQAERHGDQGARRETPSGSLRPPAVAASPGRLAFVRNGPAPQPQPARPQEIFDRAVSDFLAGRIPESVAGFDELARRAPASAPQLWQRGIALYYAGRYKDCRAQFESHRIVNPDDVENAAWHFLCVAREESPAAARAALLPVGPDPRVPMRQVYELYSGRLTPDAVIAAAGARPDGEFYARLYVGLYYEATGDGARALEHIQQAAAERYRQAGGYMHAVARIHLDRLKQTR